MLGDIYISDFYVLASILSGFCSFRKVFSHLGNDNQYDLGTAADTAVSSAWCLSLIGYDPKLTTNL